MEKAYYLLIIILPLFFCPQVSKAQKRPEIDVDEMIMGLFPQQKEDNGIVNYDEIYENLYQLYLNPLDLNTAERSDLEFLYLLSEIQINSFLKYRTEYGKLLSIYELQSIPDFDKRIIDRLLPFVEVPESEISKDSRGLLKRILHEKDNHYLISRYTQVLEQRKGYTPADTNSRGLPNARYLGSPQQYYIRYRLNHPKDFSFGFTLKKDPGEQLRWDHSKQQYGFDFLSFHAYLENQGKFKKIVLGDYQLGFGQNLIFTAGFTLGKGSETVITTRRSNIGIRPYTSSLESGFLRGGAFTFAFKPFEITAFYSNAMRDAQIINQEIPIDSTNIDDIQTAETEIFIESIRFAGLHRTAVEFAAKNTIREQIYGGNILFKNKKDNLQIGGTFAYQKFDIALQREDKIYNRFEFNGNENYLAGINYSYNWQNINFFGEFAQSRSGGKAFINGFIASLSAKVDFTFLFRHYDKDFHSFYGNAFGENSRNINETGFYWGIKIRPVKKLEFSAYYDKFNFPFLRFGVDAPSEGYEYLTKLNYVISKKINLYFQFRSENKEFNRKNNTTNIDVLEPRTIQNFIFNLNYQGEKIINLKSRIQINTQQQAEFYSEGFLIFQDIGFDFPKFSFDARFAVFDDNARRFADDNFGSTYLYVYEKNLLWAPTIVRYSGRAARFMCMVKYKVNQKLDVWVRFAQTQHFEGNTISTGLEQINGNTISQLTMQLKYDF